MECKVIVIKAQEQLWAQEFVVMYLEFGEPQPLLQLLFVVRILVFKIILSSHSFMLDCSAPFVVEIYTDATNDGSAPTAAAPSQGACLNYKQVACANN